MHSNSPHPGSDAERLNTLQASSAVRHVAHEYMACCDVPSPDGFIQRLRSLFTEDAVWEGIGERYVSKFGRLEGRDQVLAMLQSYLPPHPHFHTNGHFLSGERIEIDGDHARGEWLMQQISRYEDGSSELIMARIRMAFRQHPERWCISYFSTERIGVWRLQEVLQ